jgi:hypothetical protein
VKETARPLAYQSRPIVHKPFSCSAIAAFIGAGMLAAPVLISMLRMTPLLDGLTEQQADLVELFGFILPSLAWAIVCFVILVRTGGKPVRGAAFAAAGMFMSLFWLAFYLWLYNFRPG